MNKKIKKIFNNLPLLPRSRHNIFSGTNTWREWRLMACQYLNRHDDENQIKKYEGLFSEVVECQYAYSFGAGRMALYAAMEALDIGPGDEVIIPAYTCVVVPNAVLYRGAVPIYVDISEETHNIDIDKVEAAITKKTKAIFAQHTFGFACDLAGISRIADTYGLYVIEDCAHALGATYHGKPLGGIGDVGFFSTDHTKVLSTFLGGMVTSNNPAIAKKLSHIQQRTPFLSKKLNKRLLRSFLIEFVLTSPYNYWWGKSAMALLSRLGLMFYWRDENLVEKPEKYPYPARLSSQQALLGISQLRQLDKNISHRRRAFKVINELLGTALQQCDEASCLRYSFEVEDRENFESLFGFRWELGTWFTSVAQGRDIEFEKIKYISGSCPVAEKAAKHVVNFPTVQRTSLDFMIKSISKNKDEIVNNLNLRESRPDNHIG